MPGPGPAQAEHLSEADFYLSIFRPRMEKNPQWPEQKLAKTEKMLLADAKKRIILNYGQLIAWVIYCVVWWEALASFRIVLQLMFVHRDQIPDRYLAEVVSGIKFLIQIFQFIFYSLPVMQLSNNYQIHTKTANQFSVDDLVS
jgi:hypothetical protein